MNNEHPTRVRPRILYMVGWFYPDSVGGSERYVHMLAKDVQAQGFDVAIASPSQDEKEDNYIYDGIPVYRYPVAVEPELAEVRAESPPQYFEVFKHWLNNNKPDLVHIHSRTRGCGFFHMKYVKELKLPLVLTIHSADFMCVGGTAMLWGVHPCDGKLSIYRCTSCWLKRRGIPWSISMLLAKTPFIISDKLKDSPYKSLRLLSSVKLFEEKRQRDKVIFNLTDKVVVVSKWLKNVLLLNKIPKEKVFLSLHGLPALKSKDSKSHDFFHSGPLRVGFIGRFNYIKGVHHLVQAVRSLPMSVDIELRLYGRYNSDEEKIYLDGLHKIAAADSRIKFLGELGPEDYELALKDLDVLTVPSLWLETGPLVALEAFSMGIPVMGSDKGGITDLVSDEINGKLIRIGDVKAWAASIRRIYENRNLLVKWAANIPPVRKSSDVAKDMIGVYNEILKRNNTE